METQYRGFHVMLDYKAKSAIATGHEHVSFLGNWIMGTLEQAVLRQGIRIVHKHCEIFDGKVSPPGFALVLLLDESHCTAHCYSNEGMLAIDIFSCGKEAQHKTQAVADEIDKTMNFLTFEKTERHKHDRFPF